MAAVPDRLDRFHLIHPFHPIGIDPSGIDPICIWAAPTSIRRG